MPNNFKNRADIRLAFLLREIRLGFPPDFVHLGRKAIDQGLYKSKCQPEDIAITLQRTWRTRIKKTMDPVKIALNQSRQLAELLK